MPHQIQADNMNYERDHSHTHCWNQDKPACGIPLDKHTQCCLCDTPYPQGEEGWRGDFKRLSNRLSPVDARDLNYLVRSVEAWTTQAQKSSLLREVREKIRNHPNTFGITDKKGKGGAILIRDIEDLLQEGEEEKLEDNK